MTFCNFLLWSLSKDRVRPTASIFDDEGDCSKAVALPEATVNQTDEDKSKSRNKVSRRED